MSTPTRATAASLAVALGLLLAFGAPAQARGELDSRAFKALNVKLAQALKDQADYDVASSIRELAVDDSERAVKLVVKALELMWSSDEVYRSTREFVEGISSPRALKKLRREALKSRVWQVRVFLVDAIGDVRGNEELEFLSEAADDKKTSVAVAAMRQLGKLETRASIEVLIGIMERMDERGQSDVAWQDCRNALTRALGAKLDAGMDYRNYYNARKDKVVDGQGIPRNEADPYAEGGLGDGGGTVTIFGQPVYCERVVIILDRSGSMELADPYPPGYKAPKTGSSTTSREEAFEPDDPYAFIDDPDRKRINRARVELLRVVEELARVKAKVNIVVYSSDVSAWKEEGVHNLGAENLRNVRTFIENLKPDGVTATDEAIQLAFDIAPDADCFYLISDGFATRDGERKIPTPSILDMVRERNRLQKVQINTLGFNPKSGNPKDGADRELMEGLADMTGGTYTEIQ